MKITKISNTLKWKILNSSTFFTGQNDTGKTNLLEALYINTDLCDSFIDQVSLPPEHAALVSEFRKIKPNNDNLKTFLPTLLILLVSNTTPMQMITITWQTLSIKSTS